MSKQHGGEWQFRDHLLLLCRGYPDRTLWFVTRKNSITEITPGKMGEFQEWERVHGGFRRYALSSGQWSKHDEHKFMLIERAQNTSFFVEIVANAREIKVHPPRHLCV